MAVFTCVWRLAVVLITGFLVLHTDAVDVTAEVGEDVTLVCPLAGTFPEWLGPPPDKTALTNNNAVTAEGMEYAGDKDLRILNVTTSQAGEYTCRQNNAEDTVKLTVNSFHYDVTFSNVYMSRFEDDFIPAPRGSNLTVTCTVENAFPEPQVDIGFLQPTGDSELSDIATSSVLQPDNTYTVTASVNMTTENLSNYVYTLYCNATSGDKLVSKLERLRSTQPPGIGTFTGYINVREGVNSGSFECRAVTVYPRVAFRWIFNGKDTMKPPEFDLDTTCNMHQDQTYECDSTMSYHNLTRKYNRMKIACSLIYMGEFIQGDEWNLTVNFPPSRVTIEGMMPGTGPILALDGQSAAVACKTDSRFEGADYPGEGIKFTWFVDDKEVIVTEHSLVHDPGQYGGFITTQNVSFPVTKEMNGATVKCEADITWFLLDLMATRKLDVLYAPTLIRPFFTAVRAYVEETLELHCAADSNPASNLSWVSRNTVMKYTTENNLLVYKITTNTFSGGEYKCVADNGVSPTATRNVQVTLLEKPPEPGYSVTNIQKTKAVVEIQTSGEAPEVPRYFYVQYKTADETFAWSEIDDMVPDTDWGGQRRVDAVHLSGLRPGTEYKTRLRIINTDGAFYYSNDMQTFITEGDEETKTDEQYRNAILISVFVTFGVMLLILIVALYCVMRGGRREKYIKDLISSD